MFSELRIDDIGASRLVSQQAQTQYLSMTIEQYSHRLISSETALPYLTKTRGLSLSVLSSFDVGYCDRSLGKELPDPESFEGAMIRGTLQRFGLIKPNGRELFRGCIVVPIKDEQGAIVDMYGRKLAKSQRKGVPSHIRIHHVPRSLFNAEVLLTNREVILCSSPLEALTLLSCGVTNVVSMVGLETVSPIYAEQLQANGITLVTLGLANTPQGIRYKALLIQMLKSFGITHDELLFPVGEDVNSALVKSQHMYQLCQQLGVNMDVGEVCH